MGIGARFVPDSGTSSNRVGQGFSVVSSFALLSSLELSDTQVYEPSIGAPLRTASHFCEVVVLKLRTVQIGTALSLRVIRVISHGAQAMYRRIPARLQIGRARVIQELGSGYKVQGSAFECIWVQGSGFRTKGLETRIPGSGFRVEGWGVRGEPFSLLPASRDSNNPKQSKSCFSKDLTPCEEVCWAGGRSHLASPAYPSARAGRARLCPPPRSLPP